MQYVDKKTVVSVVVGLAAFGALVMLANKSGVAPLANAVNAIK